jgi:hypothetical protein
LFDVLELLVSLFSHDITQLEYYVACTQTMFNGHGLASALKGMLRSAANPVAPRQEIRAHAAQVSRFLERCKALQVKRVSLPGLAGGWEQLQDTMGEAEGALSTSGRSMVDEALAHAVTCLDELDSIAHGGTNNERWSDGLGINPTEAEWTLAVGKLGQIDVKGIDAAMTKVDIAHSELEAALETFRFDGAKPVADFLASRKNLKDRASVTKIEGTVAWIYGKFSSDSVQMRSKVQPQKKKLQEIDFWQTLTHVRIQSIIDQAMTFKF